MLLGGKGQTSFEYILFIGAAILFVVMVLVISRGNVIGSAAINVGSSGQGVSQHTEKIIPTPPKSRVDCIYWYDTWNTPKESLQWLTDEESTSGVVYGFGPSKVMNLAAGSSKYTQNHIVGITVPDNLPSYILTFKCTSCTATGGCTSTGVITNLDEVGGHHQGSSCYCGGVPENRCTACDPNVQPWYCTFDKQMVQNSTSCGCPNNLLVDPITNGCLGIYLSNVLVSGITNTSATFTWNTNLLSDTNVSYSPTAPYTSSNYTSESKTSHSVVLLGLTPGGLYNYSITSCNATLCNSTSDSTFTTLDLLPPANITNLASSGSTSSSITLQWTAPGDDGTSGTAAAYDLRYSTSPITFVNFGSATPASNVPAPKAGGSSESFTVPSLSIGTNYYFAIKTKDEVPNWSGISNVISASTSSIPPSCTETDGGNAPFTAGTATNELNTLSDTCTVASNLTEYYCSGQTRLNATVICDSCAAGACANCYKAGTTATNASDSFIDGCVGFKLRTYYCSGANILYTQTNNPGCSPPV